MQRKKIYLACPYSDDSYIVKQYRFHVANHVAGHLMTQGHIVFSPISHTHTICQQLNLPSDHNYWKHYDDPFVDWAEEIYIVTAVGWDKSIGVDYERSRAANQGKPVRYIDPTTFEVSDEPEN